MGQYRSLCVLVLGLAAACGACAQSQGALRWRAPGQGAPGLQAGSADFRVPCGSIAFPCEDAGPALPLYANQRASRSLDIQFDGLAARRPDAWPKRPPGLGVSLVGKAGLAQDLGVYGRFGTALRRPAAPGAGMGSAEGTGLSWGVGLSWDFSPRASAILGWDSYDFRSVAGERDVRATSLGLQWRY
jgi:OOP family OmpA-OmpF porin